MSLLITIVCFAISAGMLISLLTLLKRSKKMKKLIACVVGDGEVENNTATVRRYGKKDSVTLSKEELLESILNEIETKARV